MPDMLTIFSPGTCVNLRGPKIAGVVQQACVASSNHVTYQITWWSGCERKTEWVEAHEIEADGNVEYTHLGFRAH